MPERVQRKRTKGWKMPANTVYVGRPTMWGNPFGVHAEDGGGEAAAQLFQDWLYGSHPQTEPVRRQWIRDHIDALRGKHLACWCASGQACHADTLLELANK